MTVLKNMPLSERYHLFEVFCCSFSEQNMCGVKKQKFPTKCWYAGCRSIRFKSQNTLNFTNIAVKPAASLQHNSLYLIRKLLMKQQNFYVDINFPCGRIEKGRSQLLRGLRRGSAAARFLRLLYAVSVFLLSARGPDGLITLPKESYSFRCVWVSLGRHDNEEGLPTRNCREVKNRTGFRMMNFTVKSQNLEILLFFLWLRSEYKLHFQRKTNVKDSFGKIRQVVVSTLRKQKLNTQKQQGENTCLEKTISYIYKLSLLSTQYTFLTTLYLFHGGPFL